MRVRARLVGTFVFCAVAAACHQQATFAPDEVFARPSSSLAPEPLAPADELAVVVRREMIPFEGVALPEELLRWLRLHRVVLLGEEHRRA